MKIQVCSRTELRKMAEQSFTEPTAVISISDSDAPSVELQNQPDHILQLAFDDVYFDSFYEADDETIFINFSVYDAKEIVKFVAAHKDEVGTIICQCEMGQSRSAAVAAAISEWLNGDGIKYFADDQYSPNLYVFRVLFQEILQEVRNRQDQDE